MKRQLGGAFKTAFCPLRSICGPAPLPNNALITTVNVLNQSGESTTHTNKSAVNTQAAGGWWKAEKKLLSRQMSWWWFRLLVRSLADRKWPASPACPLIWGHYPPMRGLARGHLRNQHDGLPTRLLGYNSKNWAVTESEHPTLGRIMVLRFGRSVHCKLKYWTQKCIGLCIVKGQRFNTSNVSRNDRNTSKREGYRLPLVSSKVILVHRYWHVGHTICSNSILDYENVV